MKCFGRRCFSAFFLGSVVYACVCFSRLNETADSYPSASTSNFESVSSTASSNPVAVTRRTCVNSNGVEVQQVLHETLARQRPNVTESKVPVIVMIHTAGSSDPSRVRESNALDVLADLLIACERTGVLELASNMTLNVVGNAREYHRVRQFVYHEFAEGRFADVHVVNMNQDVGTWEFSSINLLLDYAKEFNSRDVNAHFLYIHTKGLRKDGDFISKWHWRKYLEYWVLDRQREARLLLDLGYDAVGVNVINPAGGVTPERAYTRVNPRHNWHYSGNFWWSTAAHLSKLDQLDLHPGREIDLVERLLAENLVLSPVPEMCAGVMHQASHAHVFSVRDIPSFALWDLPTGTELLQPSDDLSTRVPPQ